MMHRTGRDRSRAGRSLRHSAGLRFGLIYGALFGVSALALAGVLWWKTTVFLDWQTDSAILSDVGGLDETYFVGGLPALMEAIDERTNNNIDDDAVYLLVDAEGQRIAGNVSDWPAALRPGVSVAEVKLDRAGLPAPTQLRAVELRGGLRLLVGRDVQVRDRLAHLLTDALVWVGVVMLALGLLGAAMVRGLFRAMLANVSSTAAAISAGDFGRRVRLTGRGDELDGLAETINDMLDRIGRLMDGVRQVSNAIAHDLRTPITRARNRLEEAARPTATEAELRSGVERAIADLDGVVGVFQALLRISEIESGARRSAFAAFDVMAVLRDMSELYEAVAEQRGQRLTMRGPTRLLAYGDREMVQQAVANLLDNALKFSPADTDVDLSASPLADGRVRVCVADRGPGIPECDRARATNRFFRGESARAAPGSGLGLALVHAVAMLHGGGLLLEDHAPGLRATLTLHGAADPVRALTAPESIAA